jgi:hypothetical protein
MKFPDSVKTVDEDLVDMDGRLGGGRPQQLRQSEGDSSDESEGSSISHFASLCETEQRRRSLAPRS